MLMSVVDFDFRGRFVGIRALPENISFFFNSGFPAFPFPIDTMIYAYHRTFRGHFIPKYSHVENINGTTLREST